MLINSLTLIAGLIALAFSAHTFVMGTASIARNFALSPLLIGLTLVGFGTSAPEILVAVFASLGGNPAVAVGNAVGANVANLGFILACIALVKPLACQSRLLKWELIVLFAVTLVCYFVSFDGLGVGDSLLMLTLLLCFLIWLIRSAKKQEFDGAFEKELKTELPDTVTSKQAWLYFAGGTLGLLVSSKLSVWAALNVAHLLGVSDLIIGLTALAIGTSLPELATAITSVLKKQDDLAMGNLISSSIYNLLAVYAVPGLIAPGEVPHEALIRDFPVLLGFTGLVFLLSAGLVSRPGMINRWAAIPLLSGYGGYLWFIYQSLTGL
jgi:cation:H+ antiporter